LDLRAPSSFVREKLQGAVDESCITDLLRFVASGYRLEILDIEEEARRELI